MDERYKHVMKLLGSHKDLLDYIAKRLLEKETVEGKEFEEIIKAESHCNELTAEAGKKADEEHYINASAVSPEGEKKSAKRDSGLKESDEGEKKRRTRKTKSEE